MKCDPGRCDECSLGNTYIYPWGNEDAGIAIVGDKPALDHRSTGSECAFAMDLDTSPRSKKVLDMVLATLGRSFDEFYWTNCYKCANQISFDAERSCEHLLREEVSDFQSVVALGNNASRVLSGSNVDFNRVWHPAYVLRDWNRRHEYVEQWREVLKREYKTLDQW